MRLSLIVPLLLTAGFPSLQRAWQRNTHSRRRYTGAPKRLFLVRILDSDHLCTETASLEHQHTPSQLLYKNGQLRPPPVSEILSARRRLRSICSAVSFGSFPTIGRKFSSAAAMASGVVD